jgi:hypothetical protein
MKKPAKKSKGRMLGVRDLAPKPRGGEQVKGGKKAQK